MSRVSPLAVVNVLANARDILVTRGWCSKAPARRSDGAPLTHVVGPSVASLSTLSALNLAALACKADQRELDVAVEKLAAVVAPKAKRPAAWEVADWSDVEDRTRAEVVEALNKTIATIHVAHTPRAAVGT
jgi:hypothetical protein